MGEQAGGAQQIIVVRSGNPGLMAGMWSCIFGLLGIFTIGVIFVPLAAICSLMGMLRGIGHANLPGFGMSFIGAALTVWAIVVSPSVLLVVAALAAATSAR